EHLGGDRAAVGRTLQLDDRSYEIVGVMPAGFRFLRDDIDLWTAYQLDRNRPWRETADARLIRVVGRVGAGATIGTARSAMYGGALGVGLARGSLDALLAVAPTTLLGLSELFIDRRVLMYAFGLSLATGVIAGVAPTMLFARRSMADALRTRGSKGGHTPRIRQALVVAQVAMTVVLLCGAGVLVRTLIVLNRANVGFDARDMLTMRVAISPGRYPDERPRDFFREA